MKPYDVAIIGGGVNGTAILYTLSHYTNVKSIALIEKCDDIAQVQSKSTNNSQTLHFGDIETNYTIEKAKPVKAAAELVAAYVEKHKGLHRKFHKMALAVGDKEVAALKERHKSFGKLFPKLKLIGRKELEKVEPKVVEGRDSKTSLLAAFTEDGYAVNYGKLAQSFVKEAKKTKKADIFLSTKVTKIKKEDVFVIKTNKRIIHAKTVVVAASASTLTFAHMLGYGKSLIILPVAGDFFCAKRKLLNGKVYMMQNPKLPFAAIHGDPDVVNPSETRFGPVAKVLPILEKNNVKSFFAFLKLFRFSWAAISSILGILKDPTYLRYVVWNMVYEIPFIGKYAFVREVRKIVPSIRGKDLKYGRGIGGMRPQVVDTKTKKIALGEAKITGDGVIFNITPSPGASVCLANAVQDTKKLIEFLGKGYTFNEKKFKKDLSL